MSQNVSQLLHKKYEVIANKIYRQLAPSRHLTTILHILILIIKKILAHTQTLLPLPSLLLFQIESRAKRFTWNELIFTDENEWTGDIHFVLHKDSFCPKGKSQLGIGSLWFLYARPRTIIICKLCATEAGQCSSKECSEYLHEPPVAVIILRFSSNWLR